MLWDSEWLYARVQAEFARLLANYRDEKVIHDRLYQTESRNIAQLPSRLLNVRTFINSNMCGHSPRCSKNWKEENSLVITRSMPDWSVLATMTKKGNCPGEATLVLASRSSMRILQGTEMSHSISLNSQNRYEIQVDGQLDDSWLDLFGEAKVRSEILADNSQVTILYDLVMDQAGLVGLVRKLHGLGIVLISIVGCGLGDMTGPEGAIGMSDRTEIQ